MKICLGSYRTGAAGTARELICTLEKTDPPDWLASIGNWFIDAPGQSPAWHHFVISGIHLRPIDGVKPAYIREPGATHEFMMYALDPSMNPQPDDEKTWGFLTPCNLSLQFTARNDVVASRLLDYCATSITEGRLWAEPPLSGQVEPWRSYVRHWAQEIETQ